MVPQRLSQHQPQAMPLQRRQPAGQRQAAAAAQQRTRLQMCTCTSAAKSLWSSCASRASTRQWLLGGRWGPRCQVGGFHSAGINMSGYDQLSKRMQTTTCPWCLLHPFASTLGLLLQVLSPLMRVSPAYGEVVMGVFALIAYQVHMRHECSTGSCPNWQHTSKTDQVRSCQQLSVLPEHMLQGFRGEYFTPNVHTNRTQAPHHLRTCCHCRHGRLRPTCSTLRCWPPQRRRRRQAVRLSAAVIALTC